MMDKLKIVTLWDSLNYGAYLQAYSLGEYCKSKGFDVFYLKECGEACPDKNISVLKRFLKKIYIMLGFSDKKTRYYYLLRKAYKPYKEKFKLCNANEKFWGAIIGSDEVWNVCNESFIHYDYYVGKSLNCPKIFTYATSCNTCTKSEFESIYGKDCFSLLDSISVRDSNTKKLVDDILKITDTKLVLDPTFLIDKFDGVVEDVSYKKYIFVYGYSFSDKEISEIRSFAMSKEMKIFSAGSYLAWTDFQIPASPGQFLGLVKNASYVITSTFHGTVFSIIFNKNFCTYVRDNSKVKDLLVQFNLDNRNSCQMNINDILNKSIDYKTVNKRILNKRSDSFNYLDNLLIHS